MSPFRSLQQAANGLVAATLLTPLRAFPCPRCGSVQAGAEQKGHQAAGLGAQGGSTLPHRPGPSEPKAGIAEPHGVRPSGSWAFFRCLVGLVVVSMFVVNG